MAKAAPISTTRRAALSAALAIALPLATQAAPLSLAAGSQALPFLRPTKLGLDLIARLPEYVEAAWGRGGTNDLATKFDESGALVANPDFDVDVFEAAVERLDKAADQLFEITSKIHKRVAVAPVEHLVDMAIAIYAWAEYPVERFANTSLEEVGGLANDDDLVAFVQAFSLHLLKLAGINPDTCSMHASNDALNRASGVHAEAAE